jgi:hypothetical protein
MLCGVRDPLSVVRHNHRDVGIYSLEPNRNLAIAVRFFKPAGKWETHDRCENCRKSLSLAVTTLCDFK